MKRRIGFDLDGVLAHCEPAFIEKAQERGKLLGRTVNDVWHYKWEIAFADEIDTKFVNEILSLPHFYRYLQPCEKMLQTARALAQCGYEIDVVTARWETPETHRDTQEWLEEHQVPYQLLAHIHSSQKHLYARENGLVGFVEDRPDIANRMQWICPAFLVAAKYNDPLIGIVSLNSNVMRRERPWFPDGILKYLS